MRVPRIFLLSPAYCGGIRARLLMRVRADFPLARRLRTPEGVPVGEVFSFLSGLYFRGKLVYARTFARPPEGMSGILVITPNMGLLPIETPLTLNRLQGFARAEISHDRPSYRVPLMQDAQFIAAQAGGACETVLLGSVATAKYVDILMDVFGRRLCFPAEFVGRGDMSRGGLMLRCVDERRELTYIPVLGAIRHGPRPPRLLPR